MRTPATEQAILSSSDFRVHNNKFLLACRTAIEGEARLMKRNRLVAVMFVATLQVFAGVASGQTARFEPTSIKAIRPTLVNTITALQKRDVQAARDAFEGYDSGWNGIEVYVNVRHPDMYKDLEGGFQNRITQGLN